MKVYLNGVEITNSYTQLYSIDNSLSALIDVKDYKRGGRNGVALSTPYYRNFVISMDFWIFGTSPSDLVNKRDSFMALFRLIEDKNEDQTKTLGFKLANGVTKEIPVVISSVKGKLTPKNLNYCVVNVIVRTEREYFVSSEQKTKTIDTYQGGGMAIPMAVPMDMSSPIGSLGVVLTNNGNSEFYPTIKVNGSFNGFTLKNNTTGKQLDYSGTLGSTDFLYIDMYNRVALLNNNTNALSDISGDWWYLASGDNEILLITTSGDGNAEFLDYRDAYRGL